MAQVSNIDSGFSAGGQDVDSTEPGTKKSLLSSVKDKAKGTVRKLKGRVKKGSGDLDDRSGSTGADSNEDLEESSSDTQSGSKGDIQSAAPAEIIEKQNGSEPHVSPVGKSEDGILHSFARSGSSENSPLVAVPTSYSEQSSPVDAVMPPAVIEPTSVSDLGEESSSNLGHIPEAKEEERAAVKEVQQDGPDSDINLGSKNTFKQKDLQAIDGLPKPRGFDVLHGESSVKSNMSLMSSDSEMAGSQDLGEQTPAQETEFNAEETPTKGDDREFPSAGEGGTKRLEEDKDKPHPPGTVAEFQDSMFSSHAVQDLKPNEPSAAEALQTGVIGTFSRGYEPEANQSSETDQGDNDGTQKQHPPALNTKLHNNMFSSAVASDLKPSQTDGTSTAQENSSTGDVPASTLSREGESEDSPIFHEAPRELPPLTPTPTEEKQKSDGSSGGREDSSAPHHMPLSDEQEAEDYFDAMSDDEGIASQRSLESEVEKDFNPAATAQYEEQRLSLSDSANERIEAARQAALKSVEESDDTSNKSKSGGTETSITSILASALMTVAGSVT